MQEANSQNNQFLNDENSEIIANAKDKSIYPINLIRDTENNEIEGRESAISFGMSPLAKKAKDSLVISTAIKKRKKNNKVHPSNNKIIEDDEESIKKINYEHFIGNNYDNKADFSKNIKEIKRYPNNIPFEVESHEAFNNKSLAKLNESFTLKKVSNNKTTKENDKESMHKQFKISSNTLSLNKGNLVEEINDISVRIDSGNEVEPIISLSKFSTGIININCGYVKSGNTPIKDELIKNSISEMKRPRVSRYLYSKLEPMKIVNQHCLTIGKKEDQRSKLSQLINIDSNVNNLTFTPIKDKQLLSFKELSVVKKNEMTISKTSKSDKERSAYKEKILILEKELEKKNFEKTKYENTYSQIKWEFENAETYRMELHKYIEELKGNIRVFLRVKSSETSPSININTNTNNINLNTDKSNVINKSDIKNNQNNNIASESKQKVKKDIIVYSSVSNEQSNENIVKSKSSNNLTNKNNKKFIDSLSLVNPENNKVTANFHFNYIFKEDSIQEEVFTQVQPLIISALDGENICIFAYGATGSGKTYTMQGKTVEINNKLELSSSSGILPRAAFFLFDEFNRRSKTGQVFVMEFAALEIYNENIYDLMDNNELNLANNKIICIITFFY